MKREKVVCGLLIVFICMAAWHADSAFAAETNRPAKEVWVAEHNQSLLDMLKKNAAMTIASAQALAPFSFGYDAASVLWLSEMIDVMREQQQFVGKEEQYAHLFGAYLGEAILVACKGEWLETPQGTAVNLSIGVQAFPHNKVFRHIQNGEEDAIAGMYAMATEQCQGKGGAPAPGQ